MSVNSMRVGLRPSAPRKAPAWRMERTLKETTLVLDVIALPFASSNPKCLQKQGCETTPPTIPLVSHW
jgi:hypothetical protein